MKSTITKILSLIALLVWMSSNVSAQTLEEALDISGYTFTTGGTSNWTGQTAESSDGVDAAMSGALPSSSSSSSWLMVEVTLPVSVKFKWKKTGYGIDAYFQSSTTGQINETWRTNTQLNGSGQNWLEQEIVLTGSGKIFLRWISQHYYSNDQEQRALYLDALSIQTINVTTQSEALDTSLTLESNFQPGSSNAWIGQTNISRDGVDALLTPTTNTELSWIQTNIQGPAEVSFYWRTMTSSGDRFVSLETISPNNQKSTLATLNPSTTWEKVTIILPHGLHTVRWNKNSGSYYGNYNNGAFIDNLTVTPISNTVSYNEALDNNELTFTSGESNEAWFGRLVNGAEGGDALSSPSIGYSSGGMEASTQTTVVGPASLSFRWKLDGSFGNNFSNVQMICSLKQSNSSQQDSWIRAATLNPQNAVNGTQWKEEFIQIPSGEWQVKWHVPNSNYYSFSSLVPTVAYLDKVSTEPLTTISLNEALDTNDFVFSTSPDGLGWFGMPGLGENGTDAAQSSIVVSGQKSWLRTHVTGPGTLFYRWKGSNRGSYNYKVNLAWSRFLSPKYGSGHSVGGNNTWESDSIFIPKGTYVVEWSIQTTGGSGETLTTANLNQISFTASDLIDLGEALDATYLDWFSGSESEGIEWHGQSAVGSNLGDAAMSPFVPFGENAWLQTTVRGPGILTYKVKLPDDSSTSFSLYRSQAFENADWEQIKNMRASGYGSGYNSNNWYEESVTIPQGTHFLAWQVERGFGNSYYYGQSAYNEPHVYIDNVQFEHTGLWAGAVPVGKDLSYSPWYGFIYLTDSGWIYHFHHGWQWFYSNDSGNIWLYDLAMGWLWTTRDFYPSLFHAESGKILLYEKESHNPRRFQDTTTNEWMEIE